MSLTKLWNDAFVSSFRWEELWIAPALTYRPTGSISSECLRTDCGFLRNLFRSSGVRLATRCCASCALSVGPVPKTWSSSDPRVPLCVAMAHTECTRNKGGYPNVKHSEEGSCAFSPPFSNKSDANTQVKGNQGCLINGSRRDLDQHEPKSIFVASCLSLSG